MRNKRRNGSAEVERFPRGEETAATGGEVLEGQGAEGDAAECYHFITELFENAPHLPFFSFANEQAEDTTGKLVEFFGLCHTVLKRDAGKQFVSIAGVECAVKPHLIPLSHRVTRMHQPVGEVSIIGEKEEPRGIAVEAADREDSCPAGFGPMSTADKRAR